MPIKRIVLGGLSVLLAACAPSEPTKNLEWLLARHAEARGGAEAIEKINSIEVVGLITEPEFTVEGHYFATRAGWMRIDVFAEGTRVFTEALGPDGGWQMFGDGRVEDLSPGGKEALARGIAGNLFGLHELENIGYTLALIGKTERHGGVFWEVEQTAPDGFSEHIFIDPDTFVVASEIETSALHPDIDSTQTRQETYYSDYAETAGVLFSEKSEKRNMDTGEVMQTVVIKSRRVNGPIDPVHFLRPTPEE